MPNLGVSFDCVDFTPQDWVSRLKSSNEFASKTIFDLKIPGAHHSRLNHVSPITSVVEAIFEKLSEVDP